MRIREILALALTMVPILAWLFFNMTVILRGPSRNCPKCSAKRTRRSLPRLADRLLPAFITARRCEVCRVRFYHLKSANYCQRASVRRPQQASHRPWDMTTRRTLLIRVE
jgi:hypothetical protein